MTDALKSWDPRNIPQRYVVSFFSSTYNDNSLFIVKSAERKNSELNYFNIASSSVDVESQMCAALCMAYMENQGLTLHGGKTRANCYTALVCHFLNGDGLVIDIVEIIDNFYKFSWEAE